MDPYRHPGLKRCTTSITFVPFTKAKLGWLDHAIEMAKSGYFEGVKCNNYFLIRYKDTACYVKYLELELEKYVKPFATRCSRQDLTSIIVYRGVQHPLAPICTGSRVQNFRPQSPCGYST